MLIPVLLSVAFIIFAIMDVAEGDPVYSVGQRRRLRGGDPGGPGGDGPNRLPF